jgi:hypothetical protein
MPILEKSEADAYDLYMTPEEVANRLRQSTQTLANLRARGEGLPFVKLSNGAIRYKMADVIRMERDGLCGFSWAVLAKAIGRFGEISPAVRDRLIAHLRREIGPAE